MGKRITFEQIKNYIESEKNNGCKLLTTKEEYILNKYNTKSKLKLQCSICNQVYYCSYEMFKIKNKNKCNNCSFKMAQLKNKKTTEQFRQEIYNLFKDEYELLSEYINCKTNVLIKHKLCGCKFTVLPNNFLNNKQICPQCTKIKKLKKIRKSHDVFIKEVYNLVQDEYSVLGQYINAKTKILIRHNKCNYEWLVEPNSFLRQNTRCPKCFGTIKKTTKEFKEEVYNLYGNEYEILGEYKNSNTKIRIKHNICNYEWNITPGNFLSGHKCPKCNGGIKKKNTEIFKQEVYDLVGNEYEVLSEYKNAKTKIKFKHNIDSCKSIFKMSPDEFLSGGNRCPICKESLGEKIIRDYLKNNNILFERQYTFPDCKRIELLRYDFGILDNENNLICLIEYDGEYHYLPIEGIKKLKYQQENDQLKNTYCQQHNIPLLRIPYWEFDNIEQILTNYLSNFNLIN